MPSFRQQKAISSININILFLITLSDTSDLFCLTRISFWVSLVCLLFYYGWGLCLTRKKNLCELHWNKKQNNRTDHLKTWDSFWIWVIENRFKNCLQSLVWLHSKALPCWSWPPPDYPKFLCRKHSKDITEAGSPKCSGNLLTPWHPRVHHLLLKKVS